MIRLLAIETATDACSAALYSDGEVIEVFEQIPRQHSQRLLPMVQELLAKDTRAGQALSALTLGSGPGSFTGLRIAASCAQGLAYAWSLPAIAVSTLDIQVSTAVREGLLVEGDVALSLIDANIGETYWACYRVSNGYPELLEGPGVSRPEQLQTRQDYSDMIAIGNGSRYIPQFDPALQERIVSHWPELLPHAQDLFPVALNSYLAGNMIQPHEIQPLYVRDEVSWKKLSEQGKPGKRGHAS
ncbi:MAG: tRNA (adenosine(37)-N6)-threonylcarbamoyltransferase complex dimerization subunit type 1 TsaB [Halioglobus sp.]